MLVQAGIFHGGLQEAVSMLAKILTTDQAIRLATLQRPDHSRPTVLVKGAG